MPVYKYFKYKKEKDCISCQFFINNSCKNQLPGDISCIFKLHKIWTGKYFIKICINGRQFTKYGFLTKNEAKKAEAKLQLNNSPDKKTKSEQKHLTYKSLMHDYIYYLETKLKITYFSKLKRDIERSYINLFPDVAIYKLNYNDALKARKLIEQKNIIVDSKNKILNFLNRFFRWVKVFYGFDYVEIERINKFRDDSPKKTIKKEQIVQYEDFIKIYKSCDNNFYKLAFLTFYLFGLRLGELLGLKVNSFDFSNNEFETYIEASFKTGSGGFVLVKPKTKTSQRFYKMPENYIELIKKHIQENNLNDNDFIFFQYNKNSKNKPCPEETFRRNANKYCRLISPNFHFHMLRKSTVTKLHDKGISLEEIKNYVGHSSSSITKDVYLQTSKEKSDAILNITFDIVNDVLKNSS